MTSSTPDPVTPTFTRREDGQVDVDLGSGWELFTEALNDSVSSLPPRSELVLGPSTYWIDHAEKGARLALATQDERPFAWGNITQLRLRGGLIEGRYDFDEEDETGQAMTPEDFLATLATWRELVVNSQASATAALPETYRRNPHV